VQFIFVSRQVEALLIDYALARGEPLETVWRAQALMLEPGDSAPHDDHAHVRIACTPEEAVAGCSGGGPLWEWLPRAAPVEIEASELSQLLADDPLESEI
jgi:penicillin-insensitive murein endopeptidase